MFIHGFTQYGGPEVEQLLEVRNPSLAAGQVLIRTVAVGLNPADIKVRSGERRGSVAVTFPMAMGREAAGTVIDVGPGVYGFTEGDDVFGATAAGSGALAEYVLLDAAGTATRPPTVSAEQAACIPVSLGTALDLLDLLDLRPGATLLVLGAGGGVGSAVSQLAHHAGLRVLGVASATKAEHVTANGATHVASGPGWEDRVRAAEPGGIAHLDAVIDLVGGTTLEQAQALRGPATRLVSIADPTRAAALDADPLTRRRTIAVFERVATLVAEGALRPTITVHRGLRRARAALAEVETGHSLGKVVVTLE